VDVAGKCGEPASLLAGGLAAWRAPLSRVFPVVTPGTFVLSSWPGALLADADTVAAAVDAGDVVIDARSTDRFDGVVEPVDPRAGHIPGAVNLPFAGNLDPSTGRVLDPSELRRRYEGCGVDDDARVIVYCGSGVTACHALLAIEHAGLPAARLYSGSWSQWSADPTRPAARNV
jgi:thiosulfate/3-mercaptopyruvate sulfurtransferase